MAQSFGGGPAETDPGPCEVGEKEVFGTGLRDGNFSEPRHWVASGPWSADNGYFCGDGDAKWQTGALFVHVFDKVFSLILVVCTQSAISTAILGTTSPIGILTRIYGLILFHRRVLDRRGFLSRPRPRLRRTRALQTARQGPRPVHSRMRGVYDG